MTDVFRSTVLPDTREVVRIVSCATCADPCEIGEEEVRYPPGTSLSVVRLELIARADRNRDVAYAIDVYSFKGIWERFVSVCYRPLWKIDPATGIILERNDADTTDRDRAAAIRQRFENERRQRELVEAKRSKGGGRGRGARGPGGRTATDH